MYLVIHHYINPITLLIYYLNRNKWFCKITFNPIHYYSFLYKSLINYSLAIADALIDSHFQYTLRATFVVRPLSVNLSLSLFLKYKFFAKWKLDSRKSWLNNDRLYIDSDDCSSKTESLLLSLHLKSKSIHQKNKFTFRNGYTYVKNP